MPKVAAALAASLCLCACAGREAVLAPYRPPASCLEAEVEMEAHALRIAAVSTLGLVRDAGVGAVLAAVALAAVSPAFAAVSILSKLDIDTTGDERRIDYLAGWRLHAGC